MGSETLLKTKRNAHFGGSGARGGPSSTIGEEAIFGNLRFRTMIYSIDGGIDVFVQGFIAVENDAFAQGFIVSVFKT